jgi:hypothetical protein
LQVRAFRVGGIRHHGRNAHSEELGLTSAGETAGRESKGSCIVFASKEVASVRPAATPANEPNPILVEIRRVYRANGWKLRPALELRLLDDTYPHARPDQLEHARRVLWRLCSTYRR